MVEQQLATRCAHGDNEARKELYEQYSSRILSLCRRYASAFVKIFRVIGRFRWNGPGSLYSWMSRVALNLAFDSAKRRRRLTRKLLDVEEVGDVIPEEPGYEEAASIPPEVLMAMIEALPEGYRTVFRLYCIDGLSHRDIARLLGIKEKSSSANLSRARSMLIAEIRQYQKVRAEGNDAVKLKP